MAKEMTATEVADTIVERRVRARREAYAVLKSKCRASIAKMIGDLESSTEVELSDKDMLALEDVTEELRNLDYKFRFIEIQDSSGNTLEHKLVISVQHEMGDSL